MGMFKGIESAVVQEGGVYLEPGEYLLRVAACKEGTSRKGDEFFVAEFEVVESTNDLRPVGSRVSWMTMRRFDSFLSNVKGFVCAVAKEEADTIDEEAADLVVGDSQPLVGEEVRAQATEIETRTGRPFTRVRFFAAL